MAQHAGDELVCQLAHGAGGALGGFKQVGAAAEIRQRHVEVGAAAGAVAVGLGHEGGDQPVAVGDLLGHQLEEGEPIRHGEHLGVIEVDLELAGAIFVIEGIHPPSELVHRRHQLIEPGQVVQQGAHVVGRLVEAVARAQGHGAALLIAAQHEELGLDAEVEAEAHGGRLGLHPLEDGAAAGLEGLAVQVEVAGHPGQLPLPGQHRGGGRVGHGGHFVVAHLLGHAIEGGAGEQLRAAQHLAEVAEGNGLGLAHPVEIHIAGQGVAHPLALEFAPQALGRWPARGMAGAAHAAISAGAVSRVAGVVTTATRCSRTHWCQVSRPSPLLAETRITAQRGFTARMWASIRSMSTGR